MDWLLECFPVEALSEKHISSLQLNYLSEAKPGDAILLNKYSNTDETVFYFEGLNKASGADVFQAKLELS